MWSHLPRLRSGAARVVLGNLTLIVVTFPYSIDGTFIANTSAAKLLERVHRRVALESVVSIRLVQLAPCTVAILAVSSAPL